MSFGFPKKKKVVAEILDSIQTLSTEGPSGPAILKFKAELIKGHLIMHFMGITFLLAIPGGLIYCLFEYLTF